MLYLTLTIVLADFETTMARVTTPGRETEYDLETNTFARANPDGPYEGISNQDPNQQQEANLTNQQDEYNEGNDGERVSLWPCRGAPAMEQPLEAVRGDTIQMQWQSNNPHASMFEYNVFSQQGELVTNVFNAEGAAGYQRGMADITMPNNIEGCQEVGDCFIQFYAYSLEPRNYVTCTDFILTDGPTPTAAVPAEAAPEAAAAAPAGTVADAGPVEGVVGTPAAAPGVPAAAPAVGSLTKRRGGNPLRRRQMATADPDVATPAAPVAADATPAAAAAPAASPAELTPQPARPCLDDETYRQLSTNQEPYCGQLDATPTKAQLIWDILLPGESGEEEDGDNDGIANEIQNMRESAEELTRQEQNEGAQTLKSTVECDEYTNKKGEQIGDGIYRSGAVEDGCGATMGPLVEETAPLTKRQAATKGSCLSLCQWCCLFH